MSRQQRSRSRRAFSTVTAVIVAVVVVLTMASCTPAARYVESAAVAQPSASLAPKVRTSGAIAHSLLAKINFERRFRGLRRLRTNALLTQYAVYWGRHLMATRQFRHQDLGRIIVASHYRLAEVGENLFEGSGRGAVDAGTAHVTLMRSRTHRENILLPQAQFVGIAALCLGRQLVVVQEFGIKAGAPLPRTGQRVLPMRPLIASNLGGKHC